MFNPLSILFAALNITEPAIEDDDTAPYVPVRLPEYLTSPITLDNVHTLDQFMNALVGYCQRPGDTLQIGHIGGVEESKYGRISFYFVPREGGLSKWRDWQDFVYVVEA